MGRSIFYFIGAFYVMFGFGIGLFVFLSKGKIDINYSGYVISALGFGVFGIGSIIILLTAILDQLKKD